MRNLSILLLFVPLCANAATLRGRVVDALTAEPVARARVVLAGTAHATVTDSAGVFTLDGAPEGDVELRKQIGAGPGTGGRVQPGQLGYLTSNGDVVVQSGVDLNRYLAWTQGRLVFEDTPLREALPELGRWYDLDFMLADSALGSRHLTAVLAGEAITETLTLLGSTLDVRYERHGRTVTLAPRRSR